jgi:hypothetical protein
MSQQETVDHLIEAHGVAPWMISATPKALHTNLHIIDGDDIDHDHEWLDGR